VTSLAIGMHDDPSVGFIVAAIHDTDNDFSTAEDSRLTQYEIGGRTYSEDIAYGSGLKFHDNHLYFNWDGAITYYEGFMKVARVIHTDAEITSDFELITMEDGIHVFYTAANSEGEHGGSRVYETIYTEEDSWETAERVLPVTENEGYVDRFDVVAAENALITAYRRTDVTFTEDSFTTASDLCVQYEPFAVELTITDIQYEEGDLFGDATVALTVNVTNNGHVDAEGYTLRVGGNEAKYFADTVASGATSEAVIEYTMLEADGAEVDVTVTDENGKTDCTSVILGYSDFITSAEAKQIAGESYGCITVRNNGNMEGTGTITVYRDNAEGEILYTETLRMNAGAQEYLLLQVIDRTVEKIYVEVEAEKDYYDGDNAVFCVIPHKAVPGDINGDGEVTPDDALLFAQYYAGTAKEIQTSAADLDKDGRVTRRDAMILSRFLAGWTGYTLPYEC